MEFDKKNLRKKPVGRFASKEDYFENPAKITPMDIEPDEQFNKVRYNLAYVEQGEDKQITFGVKTFNQLIDLLGGDVETWKNNTIMIESVKFEGNDDLSAGYSLKFYRE